jgi:hypothetical protein
MPKFNLPDLINSGNAALNDTFVSSGGYMPDPTTAAGVEKKKKQWKNPYIEYAESILRDAPTLADEIRAAAKEGRQALKAAMDEATEALNSLFTDVNVSVGAGVREAAQSTDYKAVIDSFSDMIASASESATAATAAAGEASASMVSSAVASRDAMVASADAAVQAAAQRLAGATTKKEAKAALAALQEAQRNYLMAQRKGQELIEQAEAGARQMGDSAAMAQARIDWANRIMTQQTVYTYENAVGLYRGMAVENATLADYAQARLWVAERLERANQQLADAIAMRDNYALAVADSARAFASILTAQAKTIDGVQQSLTAGDITDNLRERLEKVKKFHSQLRLLLAQGLSQDAYKQLVDAGVEQGSAYVDALVEGGQGSISEVNNLTGQISAAAGGLGTEAGSFLYQAGVDAAQGLVDGLMSLSSQLDAAALALGESIAAQIAHALGIASPSRVLRAMMGDVGDGAVLGLDDQHAKVAAASAALASRIAVSPEVAAYAAQQGDSPTIAGGVSGNDENDNGRRFRDLVIQTPTQDPHGVAMEVLNEVTGRLP